jgi:hypothetical protein
MKDLNFLRSSAKDEGTVSLESTGCKLSIDGGHDVEEKKMLKGCNKDHRLV